MIVLAIVAILILVIIVLLVAGQVKQSANKGGVMEQIFRKYPRYHNRNTHAMGRIAGAKGIEKINEEFSRIRYKKGMFHTEVDENIPNWAIKEYSSAESGMPEGLIEIEPYSPHVRWASPREKVLIEVERLTSTNKIYSQFVKTLSDEIVSSTNQTVVADKMKNMGSLMNDLRKKAEGLKDTIEKPTIVHMDEKHTPKKTTPTT